MPSRIQIAKSDIVKYFNGLPKNILDQSEINTILDEQGAFWRLAPSMTRGDFVEFLSKNGKLKVVRLDFPNRGIIKYVWGEVPLYELVLSLKPDCYLTHYTAMHYHQLTDQVPEIINVNVEQKAKPRYPSECCFSCVIFRTATCKPFIVNVLRSLLTERNFRFFVFRRSPLFAAFAIHRAPIGGR